MHVAATDVMAIDHLTAGVMDALSSGYCPEDRTYFLLMLFAAVAVFFIIAFALLATASRSNDSTHKFATRVCAAVLILFALGGATWDLFGLAGCSNRATAGLTWNLPW